MDDAASAAGTAAPPARGRPAGRGTEHGRAVREEILRVAARHFAASGYNGSSLARMAADAGLSQPGLLHYFASKRQLLEAVLADRDRRDLAAIGEPRDLRGLRVLDFSQRLVAHNAGQPLIVRAFTVLAGEAAGVDHPARDYFAARYRHYIRAMADGLRHGVRSGELRADVDCAAVASEILAVMDGLQTQWLLAPGEIDMPARFDAYIDGLRSRIATPEGRSAASA